MFNTAVKYCFIDLSKKLYVTQNIDLHDDDHIFLVALYKNHIEIVKWLVEKGADVNFIFNGKNCFSNACDACDACDACSPKLIY